jgi:hypothetical protein
VVATFAACSGKAAPRPQPIAHVPAGVHLLGAANQRVFWAEGATLHWIGDPGLTAGSVPLTGVTELFRPSTFVDPTGFYYFHGNTLESVDISPDGRTATYRAARVAGVHPGGLARHRNCLYVLDIDVECHGNGALIGVPLVPGATCKHHGIVAEGKPLRPFAANDHRFVWVNGGCEKPSYAYESGIFSLNPDSGYIEASVKDELQPNELQLGDRDTYWRSTYRLRRAPSASSSSGVAVDRPVLAFVVDGGTIFYADDLGIHALAEYQDHTGRLLAPITGVEQLAVDARYLYWVTPAGDLVRLRRP